MIKLYLKPDQAPMEYQSSAAYIPDPSWTPLMSSLGVFQLLFGFVSKFHDLLSCSTWMMYSGIFMLGYSMYSWFFSVWKESATGNHTKLVQKGLRYGFILFIISEIMFFFSFFWAFFHFSLSPSVSIFCVWPPMGIEMLNPWGIPFLNTIILLSSGVSLTWAHRAIMAQDRWTPMAALSMTMSLGVIFTLCQLFEYQNCPFSMNDSVYGSIFFLATGFHGLHVIVGTIFLMVCFFNTLNVFFISKNPEKYFLFFTPQRHLMFECAAWYWHFVDVVWLFLFTTMYWWGS